jgi:GTP-binding protein YchF
MRVALVGPPQSGKSSLFAAVARAGGSHVDLSRPDQAHLAVVKVPDERLTWLAELYQRKKVIPAELEFLDLPGFDLSDEAGRARARTHWAAMRQSDMIVLVVRDFPGETVPAYRNRIDAAGDVEELAAEMIFADLDQVTSRLEKLRQSVKKPTPRREEQEHELALMERLLAALENEKPLAEAVATPAEEKLLRSFALLSLKPTLVVINCAEDARRGESPATAGHLPVIRLSAKIELELAELEPAERQVFLADLGMQALARDTLVRACYQQLNLVSFLTVGQDECRAWTVAAGTEAVAAAGQVHTDMARGFIRAETVAFEDLRAAGDMKGAKAAGKVRLEGKTYPVADGDVIHFRFNV